MFSNSKIFFIVMAIALQLLILLGEKNKCAFFPLLLLLTGFYALNLRNLPSGIFKLWKCIQPMITLTMSLKDSSSNIYLASLCLYFSLLFTDGFLSSRCDLLFHWKITDGFSASPRDTEDWWRSAPYLLPCLLSHFPFSLYTLAKLNTLPFHSSVPLSILIYPP